VALLIAVAAFLSVSRQSLDPATVNHDVAWTLYAGDRLLEGDTYGVDIIELNPPVILWVGSLAAVVSRLFDAPIVLVFNYLVLASIAGFGFALWSMLGRASIRSEFAVPIAIVMSAALVYIPSYAFGQREHLIFLLITPHLLLGALSIRQSFEVPLSLRIAAGLAAAVAICMKPHYALAWLGVEIVMYSRVRRVDFLARAENLAVVMGGLAFGFWLIAFGQIYFEAAQAGLELYGAYNIPVSLFDSHFAFLAVALVLRFTLRPTGALESCATASLVASFAGLVAVFVQGKGYDYHYIPCQLSALLAILFSIAGRFDDERQGAETSMAALPLATLAGLLSALAMSGHALLFGVDEFYGPNRGIAQVVHKHGRGEPVMFFSDSVSPAFPVLTMTGNRSTSPYSNLWQIAGHYSPDELARAEFPYRTLSEMGDAERKVLRNVVSRIEEEPPRLLMFDNRRAKHSFRGADFSFERYFRVDPRFNAQMRRYRLLANAGGYQAWILNEGTPPMLNGGSLPRP